MSNKWETLKDKGNEEFHKNNFQAASAFYSDAISNKINK